MSIKIRHGAPGAYKTSGSMEDLIAAAKSGRVIITNVRGITAETVQSVLPSFEPDKLITLDTSVEVDKIRLAHFWWWAPHGAYLHVDEAQLIWEKRWKSSDIEALSYPGGYDRAMAENRPYTMQQAFEMHRHYGWDLTFTCPDIKLIRPEIRACCEMAYRHFNTANLGVRGRFVEAMHPATTSGSKSDILNRRIRRVKNDHFKIYKSTAVDGVRDTIAGVSLWKNPRVAFLVGVIGLLGLAFAKVGPPRFLTGDTENVVWAGGSALAPAPVSVPAHVPAPAPPQGPAVAADSSPALGYAGTRPELTGPLAGQSLLLVGSLDAPLSLGEPNITQPIVRVGDQDYRASELWNLGYRWEYRTPAHLKFWHEDSPASKTDVYALLVAKADPPAPAPNASPAASPAASGDVPPNMRPREQKPRMPTPPDRPTFDKDSVPYQ